MSRIHYFGLPTEKPPNLSSHFLRAGALDEQLQDQYLQAHVEHSLQMYITGGNITDDLDLYSAFLLSKGYDNCERWQTELGTAVKEWRKEHDEYDSPASDEYESS
ncbi:hypothetical protein DXG03_006571 [Asterophora parasitica]|uniref:Uncharacterized protein n=1 Tax=Asterophora parasitica TaxID=117018 RepID=A0A9P7KDG1_9AGAR|nr:hypothetical protein DXG03_006571 [Asterophora parasitica]